jgi:hypothetical protein
MARNYAAIAERYAENVVAGKDPGLQMGDRGV